MATILNTDNNDVSHEIKQYVGTKPTTQSRSVDYGSIGKAINAGWGIANNTIGNVYTKGRNTFDANVMSNVYGDSSSDPLFGNIGMRKKAKNLNNTLQNETFISNARNSSDLARDISENNNIHSLVQGPTGSQKVGATMQKVGTGAAKGAEYGSVAGPYGMAIGAVVGAVAGLGNGLASNIAGGKRLQKANDAIAYSNASKEQGIQTSVDNFNARKMNSYDASFKADGGFVNTVNDNFNTQENITRNQLDKHNILRGMNRNNFGSLLSPNRFAEGGHISNAKRDVKGITEFNTGGSHEENKNGGIAQGVDDNGTPNLVEEGEVKIGSITGKDNQYILSNRIVLDEETAKEFGIDVKFVGSTFADAFKNAYTPYKERQGNPEVRNEIAHLINAFQEAQESIKQKQEMERRMAMLSQLTPEQLQMLESIGAQNQDAGAEGEQSPMQESNQQMQADQQQMMQEQAMQDPSMQEQAMQQQQMDPAMQQQMQQQVAQQAMQDPNAEMPMMAYDGSLGKRINKFSNGGYMRNANYYGEGDYLVTPQELARREGLNNAFRGFNYEYYDRINDALDNIRAYDASVYNQKLNREITDPITLDEIYDEDPILTTNPTYEPSVSNSNSTFNPYESNIDDEDGDEIAQLTSLQNILNQMLNQLALDKKTGSDEYIRLASELQSVSGRLSNLKRARAYDDLKIRSLERVSNARFAPAGAAIHKLINQNKWQLDSNDFDNTTKEGLARSLTSAPIIGERYTPRYIDPNFGNNLLLGQTAQAIRNASMLSAGNRAMASAMNQQAFNSANAQRGQNLYNAMLQNENLRKSAFDYNYNIDNANRQAIMTSDSNNSNKTFNAYNRIAQNRQDVNSFNLNTRSKFYDNAFNQLGNVGQDSFNRANANKMVANGLYGGYGATQVAESADKVFDNLFKQNR